MYLRKLRKTDVEKIQKLNPDHLDLSILSKSFDSQHSIGVFENHNLVAYALVSKRGADWILKDFYSIKAKHYIYLFGHYFKESNTHYYTLNKMVFELSKEKIDILNWYFTKVKSDVISLIEESEGGFIGYFKVKTPLKYKYRQLNVLHVLYSNIRLNVNYFTIFDDLSSIMSLEDIEDLQNRIFKETYKRNMGFLEQIHPDVLTISHSSKSLYNGEKEQFSKRLKKGGFSMRNLSQSSVDKAFAKQIPMADLDGRFRREYNKLHYFKGLNFKGFREYDASLALYRFYIKKALNHLKQNNMASTYWILDREGYTLIPIGRDSKPFYTVPYLFKSIFIGKIKTAKTILKIQRNIAEVINVEDDRIIDNWTNNVSIQINKLKRMVGEEETVLLFNRLATEFVTKKNEPNPPYSFSNWLQYRVEAFNRLINCQHYLTRGVLVKFLYMPINQYHLFINRLEDLNSTIKVKDSKYARKRFRKEKYEDFLSFNEAVLDVVRNELNINELPFKEKVENLLSNYFIPLPNPNKEDDEEFIDRYRFSYGVSALEYHTQSEVLFDLLVAAIDAYDSINKELDWDTSYPMGNLIKIEKLYGYNTAIKTLDFIIKSMKDNDNNMIEHDIGYALQILYNNKNIGKHEIISNEAFLYIIENYSLRKINELNSELVVLTSYKNNSRLVSKKFRERILHSILNRESLEPLIAEMDKKVGLQLLKKYDSENTIDYDNAVDFVNRMRKYLGNATLSLLLNTFKEEGIKMINGTKEGLFEPKEYVLPNSFLIKQLKVELSNRGKNATGTNPRRLYHHLSKIRPINELMNGEATSEEIEEVFKAFRVFNIKEDKRIRQASLLRGLIEPKCSPEFLIAGNASVCCMSFGEENAYDYAMEKGFGLFNIYYKGRIIANSVIWINEFDNHLVIDNVEVHPNYTSLNPLIKKLYLVAIKDLVKQYQLDGAVQGDSYNDLNLGKGSGRNYNYKAKEVKERDFYTDAHSVKKIPL